MPTPDQPRANTTESYCVIGAGPSGLATARAFAAHRIPFQVLERHHDVGGIWSTGRADSPVYDSAHFISSRTQSAFDDFAMPDDYPDYPRAQQIADYIGSFADRFDLRRHVQFGTTVDRVSRVDDGWAVRLAGGETRRYRGVVIATGHNADPVVPCYTGCFEGESFHSSRYRSPSVFDGKRVLIVGGGNSACDIACDAVGHASRTYLSMRRGYHYLPKHVFGQPTDAFFRSGPHLPAWLAQPLLTVLLRLLVGDLRRYGLPKPDHKVLETHPIMNTQLLHHLSHGDITPKPDVVELRAHSVVFADGSEADVDLIIYATGYRTTIPVFDQATVPLTEGVSGLYLNIISRDLPELYVVGLFETDGAAYPVVSKQAELVARLIAGRAKGSAAAAKFDVAVRGPAPDMTGGVKYKDSPRHRIYVQFDEYVHRLDKEIARLAS
ncbi:MAG TPA: NAD(P)-binding domain-containing protein [Gemmatimonadaceae bacterium]|nr:NAD(P)-binding domain-containing protein [Gemmatimonadaceae bacterium]